MRTLPGFFLLLAFHNCAAQTEDACEQLLHAYTAGAQSAPRQGWQLGAKAGAGRLYYYGALHETDTAHPQFHAIAEAWEHLQPSLAFYEGPDRGTDSSAAATIARLGESGYVRFLAKNAGIRAQSLEDPVAEYRAVAALHGNEKAALFYLLREAARLRTRKGADSTALAMAVNALCGRMRALLPGAVPIGNAEELATTYHRYWKTPFNWWEAPEAWFDPKSSKAEALFLPALNRSSSEYRNVHMYRLLTEAVLRGERVFAVVGKDHIPQQADAIRCRVGGK